MVFLTPTQMMGLVTRLHGRFMFFRILLNLLKLYPCAVSRLDCRMLWFSLRHELIEALPAIATPLYYPKLWVSLHHKKIEALPFRSGDEVRRYGITYYTQIFSALSRSY